MGAEQDELLAALYDAHAQPLYWHVLRMTRNESLAEDIVQETLLKAWKHADILAQPEANVRSWVYTVARNLVIDDKRSARSRREFGTDEVPEVALANRTDATLDTWLVTDALAELSYEHRSVIVHCYYGAKTVNQVAGELGLPPGTVKSRLHYGMKALKLALQERGVSQP